LNIYAGFNNVLQLHAHFTTLSTSRTFINYLVIMQSSYDYTISNFRTNLLTNILKLY